MIGKRRLLWALLTVACGIAADQLCKFWAAETLKGKGVVDLIPGVLHLVYVENTGAAFGLFDNSMWILTVISAMAALFIVVVLLRGWIRHPLGWWSLVFVLSGALGNLLDRAARGFVVDMFEFSFVRFAVFNVADIFVTVGGALVCVYLLFMHDKTVGADKT